MAKVKFVDSVWPLIIFLGLGVGILTGIALYCQVINPPPSDAEMAEYRAKTAAMKVGCQTFVKRMDDIDELMDQHEVMTVDFVSKYGPLPTVEPFEECTQAALRAIARRRLFMSASTIVTEIENYREDRVAIDPEFDLPDLNLVLAGWRSKAAGLWSDYEVDCRVRDAANGKLLDEWAGRKSTSPPR